MKAKKNIILLMTDQQRFDTIAAAGNSVIKTPNLDRLAARGILFTHATTPQPLCGPARHSIFTGVKCTGEDFTKNRAHWRPDGRFIPELLAEAGYRTGGFGKFHFHPDRVHHGFQHYAVHEEATPFYRREDLDYVMHLKEKGYGHLPYTSGVRGLLYFQPQRALVPEEHHESKWVADRAIDFINKFHKDPFFLFASWLQPHFPLNVPESYADMYPNEEIPDPAFAEDEVLPWFLQIQQNASDIFRSGEKASKEKLKRVKALYYASISFIDKQIGRILDSLEKNDLLDDALIIFTSDHGEILGDHKSFTKVNGYEGSVRIPFIISAPGLEQGRKSGDFVNLYDIFPTICDFAGITPPPESRLEGESILNPKNEISKRDKAFFGIGTGEDLGTFVGVRTEKWKYNYYFSEGLRQLFNLQEDPDELNNLCLGQISAKNKKVMEELHGALLDWNKKHGYPGLVENGDFKKLPPGPDWHDKNSQYEEWTDKLEESEKNQIWSDARAIYEAIKNEKYTDPAELDLEYWESRKYPGCIQELEGLMNKKLR